MPAARMPSTSSYLKPRSRSITSTRRVTSSGCGRGTTMIVWPASRSTRAMSSMFSASRRKSSSSMMVSAKSSTSAGGLASAATGMRPTRNGRDPRHRRDVAPHQLRDARPLHLDDHLLAGAQARRVHLRDRRGGEALARRSARTRSSSGRAEVLLDDLLDDGERLRRHLIAAALELLDQLVGKDALARRDDLPELDVRRAEPLEGETQPARQIRARDAGPPVRRAPTPQRTSALPTSARASVKRPRGGNTRRRTSSGTSACEAARRASMPSRHVSSAGTTSHGPCSPNANSAVSPGGLPSLRLPPPQVPIGANTLPQKG